MVDGYFGSGKGDYHWAIGVVLAAVASVISNLGLNFQKLTHIYNAGQSDEVKRFYFRSKLWILGLCMIIFGSVADFAALAFGAQSIIAPLGSLTLVSNVFFAPCLLGERLTRRDLVATAGIVIGATVAVIFASHKDTIYSLNELFGFYHTARFGVYAISVLVIMGVLYAVIQHMESVRLVDDKSAEYLALVKYHRFAYAAISGTVGAQSVLFAKCAAELVVNTFLGKGFLLSYYQSWLVLAFLGLTIFLQIKWLNQGLQRFDALYIVPVFQSFWILLSVVSGLVFFGEYKEMNHTQVIVFPIGIVITIAGVYYLSQREIDEGDPLAEGGSKQKHHDLIGPDGQFDPSRDSEIESAPLLSDREAIEPRIDMAKLPNGEHTAEPHLQQHQQEQQQRKQQHQQQQQQQQQLSSPALRPTSARDMPHHRFDSGVGFMGTDSPAAFLPTRTMTMASSMRESTKAEQYEDDDPHGD